MNKNEFSYKKDLIEEYKKKRKMNKNDFSFQQGFWEKDLKEMKMGKIILEIWKELMVHQDHFDKIKEILDTIGEILKIK